MPNMLTVQSSTIKAVGYDPVKQSLHVLFRSGPDTYAYQNVPPQIYSGLLSAKSKGLYHANVLKGKFQFEKRKPTPPQL